MKTSFTSPKLRRAATFFLLSLSSILVTSQDGHPSRPQLPVGQIVAGHDMTTARGGHTATVLPDFRILIVGGKQERGLVLATTEIYDPNKESFIKAAKLTVPREGHIAASLADTNILIAGGSTRGGVPLASCEVYDYETERFIRRGNMHAARAHASGIILRDGRVLVSGGDNGTHPLDSAEAYDVLTGKWRLVGRMSAARSSHTSTVLSDGRVLVAGGIGRNHVVLASTEIFDPQTNKFTAAPNLLQPRANHTAVLLASGSVLVAGGVSRADHSSSLDSAELYKPGAASTLTGKLNQPRHKMADTAVLLDGRILITGGGETAEIYDPKTGSFRTVAGSLDMPRFSSAASQMMDGSSRIFGGYDAKGVSSAKTWIYRP